MRTNYLLFFNIILLINSYLYSQELVIKKVESNTIKYEIKYDDKSLIDYSIIINNLLSQIENKDANIKIQLQEGKYYFKCNFKNQNHCLNINNFKNISFYGKGYYKTKIIIENNIGFINASSNQNLDLSNFSVEYKNPLQISGIIKEVNLQSVVIKLDSSNIYKFNEYPFTTSEITKYPDNFLILLNNSETSLKENVPREFQITNIIEQVSKTNSENLYQLDLANNSLQSCLYIASKCFSKNDVFVIPIRSHPLFYFNSNFNINFSNIIIYSSNGMATVWQQNKKNIQINNIKILKNYNNKLSINADAIHMLDNTAQTTIENNYFELMSDDAINIRASAFPIESVNHHESTFSKTILNIKFPAHNKLIGFSINDLIQIVAEDSPHLIKNILPINSVSEKLNEDGSTDVKIEVKLNREIKQNDIFFNLKFANGITIIRNNIFSNFRGGFQIRSPGAIFENNKILGQDGSFLKKDNLSFSYNFVSATTHEGPSLIIPKKFKHIIDEVKYKNNQIIYNSNKFSKFFELDVLQNLTLKNQ